MPVTNMTFEKSNLKKRRYDHNPLKTVFQNVSRKVAHLSGPITVTGFARVTTGVHEPCITTLSQVSI